MKCSKRVLNLLVLFLSILMVNVNAQSLVNQSSYDVKKGEELTVFVDLDPNNNNKYNYSALLSYDNNVLEVLNEDSFINDNSNANSLSEVSYEKDNKKFVLVTTSDSATKDVNVKETEVNLTDVVSKVDDKETKLDNIKFNVVITDVKESSNTLPIVLGVIAGIGLIVLVLYNVKFAKAKDRKKVNITLGVAILVFALVSLIRSTVS